MSSLPNNPELEETCRLLKQAQGHAGMASRWGHGDAVVAAHRERVRALKAEVWIRRILADAPPLSSEQRDRLSALLRGTE